MVKNPDMRVLFKAALVGATISAALSLIMVCWPQGSEGDSGVNGLLLVLVLAPFPLGLLLGWATKLPHWQVVGALAPFAMYALVASVFTFAQWLPEGELMWYLSLAVPPASGFFVTAWLCAHQNQAVRASVVIAIILLYVAAPSAADEIRESERTRELKNSGIPMIAPVIPNYRLDSMDEWSLPEMVSLTYYPEDDGIGSSIEVHIRRGTVASPKAACVDPKPNWGWKAITPCQQIAPDVWTTRLENGYTPVYARHGEALVQVGGYEVPEADLLAVLPTFRPVTAEELAAIE